jgi:hypothetical protein
MDLWIIMQPVSILIEAAIVVLACMLATRRHRRWGWFLAVTFAIYVLYDTARYFALNIPGDLLAVLFFIASISALWAVWQAFSGHPEHEPD